jgi:hypothetical protein
MHALPCDDRLEASESTESPLPFPTCHFHEATLSPVDAARVLRILTPTPARRDTPARLLKALRPATSASRLPRVQPE